MRDVTCLVILFVIGVLSFRGASRVVIILYYGSGEWRRDGGRAETPKGEWNLDDTCVVNHRRIDFLAVSRCLLRASREDMNKLHYDSGATFLVYTGFENSDLRIEKFTLFR